MKCINCGHELEPGSGFCENCGMLMSLDDNYGAEDTTEATDIFSEAAAYTEQTAEQAAESQAEEYTSDKETAEELETDETEEFVESEAVSEEEAAVSDPEPDEAESDAQPEEESEEEAEAVPVITRTDTDEDEPFDAAQDDDEPFDADAYEQDAQSDKDDMYITAKGRKKGVIAAAVMIIVLAAVVALGVKIIKNNFDIKPVIGSTAEVTDKDTETDEADETDKATEKETEEADETTEAEETEKETEEATEETTEKATTEKEEPSQTERETEGKTDEASAKPTTTAPSTTAPTTTAPSTTAPSTTAPSTTAPSATRTPSTTQRPSTTANPYGFNDVTVQKPGSTSSETYKVYSTVEGLNLRSGPSASSERVVYLPLGTSCTVYASQNGFLYVRSDRYGVYGWVSADYVSKSRPESKTTAAVSNLVSPDKTYSKAQTKHVNAAEGLRLRKGPGASYDIILLIDNGFPVKVIGYSSKVSGWVYVTDTTHGVSGWVSSAYIK